MNRSIARFKKTIDDDSHRQPQKPFRLAELRGHPVVVSFLPSPGSEQEPSEPACRRRAI